MGTPDVQGRPLRSRQGGGLDCWCERGRLTIPRRSPERNGGRPGDHDDADGGEKPGEADAQPVKRGLDLPCVRGCRRETKRVDAIRRAIRACGAGLSNAAAAGFAPIRWRIHAA